MSTLEERIAAAFVDDVKSPICGAIAETEPPSRIRHDAKGSASKGLDMLASPDARHARQPCRRRIRRDRLPGRTAAFCKTGIAK